MMSEFNELTMGIEDKLDEALAMLAADIPLETILTKAGEDAEVLRPLLQIANETATLPAVPVPPPDASLQRMLAYGKTLSAGAQPVAPAQPGWLAYLTSPFKMWGQSFVLAGTRMAALTAVVMFVFLAGTVLGGSMTLAAQESLPGQRMYSLKRLSETVRLGLVWTDSSRAQLQEIYNQRRWMETNLLLNQGQQTDVTFDANIRSFDGTTLELDGLVIQINSDTVVKGELTPGARIQLAGITQPPNTLVALTLTVIEPAPAMPTSTPTATPTVTPTATPSATMTSTPTPTLVMSQDNDTLPVPTSTPISPNENNDNRDDNANNNNDDNDDANQNDNNNDNENDNENDNDDNNNGDDTNENDDTNDNDDDDANENDDSNSNDDDGSNENGDDDEDNDDDDSDNSDKGNSDDRDDDDNDDDE
jgi:hypothetical protein